MPDEREKAMIDLAETQKIFDEIEKEYDAEANSFWDGLSQDDKQRAFYSVLKRLVQGELRDRGSYRYVLYDVFGFDSDSYFMGMNCGYMELHNSIYTQQEMRELRDRELASKGIEVKTYKVERKSEQHLGDE
jgi:hypothetical protein